MDITELFGGVIYEYTRKQAIEDGVLVDVTETAKEAGLRLPTAVTRRVWDEIITPDDRSRPYGQSEEGRLWDVLCMLRFAISRSKNAGSEIRYTLYAIMKEKQRRIIELKCICGPGDNMEPVLTIMMPDED